MSEELQKAVTDAATTLDESTGSEEKVETTKPETKPAEKEESEKEEPALDPRTAQALQLMDALENPRTAVGVVQNLMRQLGMAAPKTEVQEERQESKIRQLIKAELGSDYAFLSEKLGTAIEKAMELQKEEFYEVERSKEAQAAAKEYERFIVENKVTDAEAGEIMKIVDEMPWSGRTSLSSYLSKVLKMHRGEVSARRAEQATKQKQTENYDKRPKTMGVEANEDRVLKGSHRVSAKEAVEAAMRGELLE